MGRKINLGGERARVLKERSRERSREARRQFLDNMPTELAKKRFSIQPTPAKEEVKIIRMDNGYAFTEYKSLVKLSVPGVRSLPDVFEMTEIVLSGVEIEDDD